jgi:hypothetical protein
MRFVEAAGSHLIEVRADTDEVTRAHLDIRFKRIRVLLPIGRKKRYPALDLTVSYAVEPNPPAGRKTSSCRTVSPSLGRPLRRR